MSDKNNCEYCHEPNAIIDMHNNQRIWVVGIDYTLKKLLPALLIHLL